MGEWELEFGGEEPQSVGKLMRGLVDGQMSSHMSANQRASAAWWRANGDRERAHTTGVFLKKPRRAGAAPILGVYVDSHALATDFGVNKDIYLARLANVGLEVSGIEFLPSRNPRRAPKATAAATPAAHDDLPELTAAERAEVSSLVEGLPEELRQQAARAIELSKRREKR